MECKLICSDIDGTLLDVNRQLSKQTLAAVQRVKSEIPFLLISSRMPKSMRLLQSELGTVEAPLIAYNGALVLGAEGKIIQSTEISYSITQAICNCIPEFKLHFSLYHQDEWVVPAMDFWAKREMNNTRVSPKVCPLVDTLALWKQDQKGAHKIMAMGDSDQLDFVEQFISENYSKKVNSYRSKNTYLEISNSQLDKASALSKLLSEEYPNFSMDDVMAFGDNYNDQTILESVGRGVAVANAKPEILSSIQTHTLSNHEHGVAFAIEQYC